MTPLKCSYYSQQWSAKVFLFSGPPEDFIKYVQKRFKFKWQQELNSNYSGLAFRIISQDGARQGYGIYMPQLQMTVNNCVTLSHQCIHIALDILQDRQVQFNIDNQQVLTYTHDAIYKYFLQKLQ